MLHDDVKCYQYILYFRQYRLEEIIYYKNEN